MGILQVQFWWKTLYGSLSVIDGVGVSDISSCDKLFIKDIEAISSLPTTLVLMELRYFGKKGYNYLSGNTK